MLVWCYFFVTEHVKWCFVEKIFSTTIDTLNIIRRVEENQQNVPKPKSICSKMF